MNVLKQLFSRRRLYDELSEEIREHLEEKIEELVAGGMSPKEAGRVAQRFLADVPRWDTKRVYHSRTILCGQQAYASGAAPYLTSALRLYGDIEICGPPPENKSAFKSQSGNPAMSRYWTFEVDHRR